MKLNKKLDAVQKNIAAVIVKELQPHLSKSAIKVQAMPVCVSSSDLSNVSTLSDSSAHDNGVVVSNGASHSALVSSTAYSEAIQVERQDVSGNDSNAVTTDGISVVEEEVDLLSISEVTQFYVKSCSRGNMAAKLVKNLFDEPTRMTSNVNGRDKKRLDPEIMAFVKWKCFEFFPSTSSNKVEEDWSKCVLAIDESCRRLNNKPRKKEKMSESHAGESKS